MDAMFDLAGRGTFVKIDLNAILHNYLAVKELISKQTEIIAVVKGNAYGHGSVVVSQFLQKHGCSNYAVATASEGQRLREAGIDGTVIILGNLSKYDMLSVHTNRLTPTIADTDVLHQWIEFSKSQKCGVDNSRDVVIEVDTGMNRNGCSPDALPHMMEICAEHNILVHSIMTHFPNTWDVMDSTRQLGEFLDVVAQYRKRGIKVHAACSGSIAIGVATDLDFVRPGDLLYGVGHGLFEENDEYKRLRMLYRPALSWYTRPNLVKNVPAGSTIGYNKAYRSESPQTIAVLPVGFGDGFSRRLSGHSCITDTTNTPHQILGSVCMDSITINADPSTTKSDTFCLLSDDRDQINACQNLGSLIGTSHSEILTRIKKSIPRLYMINGNVRKEGVPCEIVDCADGCTKT